MSMPKLAERSRKRRKYNQVHDACAGQGQDKIKANVKVWDKVKVEKHLKIKIKFKINVQLMISVKVIIYLE